MFSNIPKIENKFLSFLITVSDVRSLQAYIFTKGNRQYSSPVVSKYLFLEELGGGPLKSMFKRSKGWVAFIGTPASGFANFGLHLKHTLQIEMTVFMLLIEKGRFLSFKNG